MGTRSLLVALALTLVVARAQAQTPWRFGLEHWRVAQLCNAAEANGATALDKSAALLVAAQVRPSMNVDWAPCGFWGEMQPVENGPINFSETDEWVRQLQSRGINLQWNIRLAHADWATQNDPGCFADEVGSGPCSAVAVAHGDCAPDSPKHEQDWYDYVFALVDRYDHDGGAEDMPGLEAPVEFYLLPGEVRLFIDCGGHGSGYWWSDIDALLRVSRIAHQALHDADPSGNAKLVCPGGIAPTLFEDFPDYPAYDGPTVMSRLALGLHGDTFLQGWDDLLKMLQSFGDDSDGIECDYVAWHPHTGWRGIDQSFSLIHSEMTRRAGSHTLPILIDDMWVNIITSPNDPTGFFTPPDVTTMGDFPNSTVSDMDALLAGLSNNDDTVISWYYARQARQIPKNFAMIFGLGAERGMLSWMADDLVTRAVAPGVGWQGVLDTAPTGFAEKPGYYTYRLLIDLLGDWSAARELAVSNDPRTRCFAFERPSRSAVAVCWSETGPPPDDYAVPNGEQVALAMCGDEARITHPITLRGATTPEVDTVATPDGTLELHLGHEPVVVENICFDDGAGGAGGSGASSAGGGPPGGAAAGGAAATDSDCSCRVVGDERTAAGWWTAGCFLAVGWARRRRRRRARH